MKQALFWKKLKGTSVKCGLCPNLCAIKDGERGICGVRENKKGKLLSLVYGKAASVAVDPIEKKPLFHFLPGSNVFSFGTVGCNLKCAHCQNWQTTQVKPEEWESQTITPKEIVKLAVDSGSKSIAYTYNEPTVFIEYALETAKLARKKGLKNVSVTNGFINKEPAKEFYKYIDAVNVDLKSFSEDFYKKQSCAKLSPVLEAIKIIKEKKVWIELTNLIIPKQNDDLREIEKMCRWVKEELGKETPLHFTAFFPAYKATDVPATKTEILLAARERGLKAGLDFVYIGNVLTANEENTFCPACKKLLVERSYFDILRNEIKKDDCPFCSAKIPGVWT